MEWNWWVLAGVPVAYFLQLCFHELSHLLVGLAHEGRKPTGFYPYPHKHNGKFYFARYTSGPGHFQQVYYRRPHIPRHIAPFWAGLLVVAISALVFFLVSPAWRVFALPTAVAGLVDMLWFWRGYFWGSDGCDGKRWRNGDGYRFNPSLKLDAKK